MEKIVDELVDMLYAVDDPIRGFKKNTYAGMFEKFESIHEETIEKLEQQILAGADRTTVIAEISEAFVREIEAGLNEITKKRFRENKLLDYNMSFVTYFFPAIVDKNKETGEEFCEQVIRDWKAHFPATNLKLATFEQINSGFKQRFCYITTAVCESLGKPDDCYELNLLRDYRDSYLMKQEDGEALVQRYYDIAPTIVKYLLWDMEHIPSSLYPVH